MLSNTVYIYNSAVTLILHTLASAKGDKRQLNHNSLSAQLALLSMIVIIWVRNLRQATFKDALCMNLILDNTQAYYLLTLNRDRQALLTQASTPSPRLQSSDVEYGISIDIEQLLMDAMEAAKADGLI